MRLTSDYIECEIVNLYVSLHFFKGANSPRQVCQLTPGVLTRPVRCGSFILQLWWNVKVQILKITVICSQDWKLVIYNMFHNFKFKYGVCGSYRGKCVQLAPVSPNLEYVYMRTCFESSSCHWSSNNKQQSFTLLVSLFEAIFGTQSISKFMHKNKLNLDIDFWLIVQDKCKR